MAEKAEKKPDAAPAAAAPAAAAPAGKEKKGGIGAMLGKMPVIMGGVMILEAAVLFAGFKFLGGGPSHANAAAKLETELKAEDKAKGEHTKTAEVAVLDFKAPNKVSGRTFIYDVSVCVRIKTEFEQRVKETIKSNENLIKDRVRTIIEQNDPEKLGGGSEPGLETLRRQVKHQLEEILGEGMIEEVLVPRCIPFRTDF